MYTVHWGNCNCCLLKFTLGCPLPNKYYIHESCMICFRSNFIKYTNLYFGKLKLQHSILCHLVASHVNSIQFKFQPDFSNNFRYIFFFFFLMFLWLYVQTAIIIYTLAFSVFDTTELYDKMLCTFTYVKPPYGYTKLHSNTKIHLHILLAIFVGLAWNTCYNIVTYRLSLGNWLTKHVSMSTNVSV